MNRIRGGVILLAVCLGGTALAQDVRYNFAAGTDFNKYKTYRWTQHPDSMKLDQLTLTQMEAAFDAELIKKGLVKATGASSDLVIVYQFARQQEREVTTFDSGYGYGPGWRGGWYGGGGGFSTSTTSTITIGSVDLDMYDALTKTLVWRGSASKTLDPKAKPDKRLKNMAKAAAKMLKNYPPPKK